jgi:hypothetical protein
MVRHTRRDVHNLTLVRLELDQAGEAASDRLELRRTLHGGQVLRGFPLQIVEDAGAVTAAVNRRRMNPGYAEATRSTISMLIWTTSSWFDGLQRNVLMKVA